MLSDSLIIWQAHKKGDSMIRKTVEELKAGDTAEIAKTISESDIYLYAAITGDLNPAHTDEEYAKKTFFKTRIAQGMLLAGFISAVVGNKLPWPGTIYVKRKLNSLAPVRIGDTITARAEVTRIIPEQNKVRSKTNCINHEGAPVLDGKAVVSPPISPKQ